MCSCDMAGIWTITITLHQSDINPNLDINPTNSCHSSMSHTHKFKWDVTFLLSVTCLWLLQALVIIANHFRYDMVNSLSVMNPKFKIGSCIRLKVPVKFWNKILKDPMSKDLEPINTPEVIKASKTMKTIEGQFRQLQLKTVILRFSCLCLLTDWKWPQPNFAKQLFKDKTLGILI